MLCFTFFATTTGYHIFHILPNLLQKKSHIIALDRARHDPFKSFRYSL